jgi:hypothetical protein
VGDAALRNEIKTGQSVPAGGRMIIPVSRAFQIRLPGMKGGLTWNRPVGLWVQSPDGSEEFIPIQDVTRRAQIMALVAGLVGSLCVWVLFRWKSTSHR